MKKLITLLIAAAFLAAQSPMAYAASATYSVQKVLSGSVTTKVSYGSSECKKIAVKYKASSKLAYPTNTIVFSLSSNSVDDIASTEVKVGSEYGSNSGIGGAPYSGTVYLEVCKVPKLVPVDEECDPDYQPDNIFGFECEYEESSAAKPGTYYFQAVVYEFDVKTFPIQAFSKKIKIVITK
jgi:hypothetical protein